MYNAEYSFEEFMDSLFKEYAVYNTVKVDDVKDNNTEVDANLNHLLNLLKFSPSREQLEILKSKNQPLNGLSCAGSGKTTTLILKLLAMELIDKVNPARILTVTFSREGANEIQKRHKKYCEKLGIMSKISIGTFHSTYKRLIEQFTGKMNVMDSLEQVGILKKLCMKYIPYCNNEKFDAFVSLLSYNINNILFDRKSITSTSKFTMSGIQYDVYDKIVSEFKKYKEENNKLDFDDMQVKFYELISRNEDIREKVRSMWDYFVVDEFQDISKIQLEILKLMVANPNNLITIGDDDQCIYEWRGSSIDYIVDMPVYFIGTKRIIMDTNYRCAGEILKCIIPSISKNQRRVEKDMKFANDGGVVNVVFCNSDIEEACFVAKNICDSKEYFSKLNEIAILYRNHSQAMFIVDLLLRENIPIQLKNPEDLLYNNTIVKDLLNITDFASNQDNRILFKQVASKILKYMSIHSISNAIKDFERYKNITWENAVLPYASYQVRSHIRELKDDLDAIEALVLEKAPIKQYIGILENIYSNRIRFLVDKMGFDESEIMSIFSYFNTIAGNQSIEEFRRFNMLVKNLIKSFANTTNAAKVMTMHACKGLEFERVYIVGDTEDHCPNNFIEKKIMEMFGDEEARLFVEQERRLHYVAWTRAKKELYVLTSKEDMSRFLKESLIFNGSEEQVKANIINVDRTTINYFAESQ